MLKKLFLTITLSCLVLVNTAKAEEQTVAQNTKLSREEILKKAEDYFNNLKTLKAVFVQASSTEVAAGVNETIVGGIVHISRPGKMRLEYDKKEVPVLIIADGKFLIYHDKKLDQITYLNLDSTPAGVILKDNLSFNDKKIQVIDTYQNAGVIEISLIQKDDPIAGTLKLIFSEKPFALKKWEVKDAHNVTTVVSLMNVKTGIEIDPKLFVFKDPRRTNLIDRNIRR